MKILIASKYAPNGSNPIGGVQTWSKTVGDELKRLGHKIDYWQPSFKAPDGFYDAGIFANWKRTESVAKYCNKIVRVSHGIIDDEAIGDVYTSEEVRDKWFSDGKVIRQPIDTEFWTPGNEERVYLTRFSYRTGLSFLPQIAQKLKLKYQHIRFNTPEQCRLALQKSAIVVATGRAACEAMACGATVIIADDRRYQKPLIDADIKSSMLRNYSGRGGVIANHENVLSAIYEAIGKKFDGRKHVLENHDSRKIVQQLLCLLY